MVRPWGDMPDGSRSIRSYRIGSRWIPYYEREVRFALLEKRDGKTKRVGTARTVEEAEAWMRGEA